MDPKETSGDTTVDSGERGQEWSGVRRFSLTVVDGASRGQTWHSVSDAGSIGSHTSNDVVIDDATVSRFHCEIAIDAQGARIRDLESRNGTIVDGVVVRDAMLRGGSLIRCGRSVVRFQFGTERNPLPLSTHSEFGSLVGTSVAMRFAFGLLERAAASDATVLLEGETGTGKEGAAESIHLASARRDQAFVVIDCSAIPAALLESELFGHERGAFTGAAGRRIGAFEEASGGTVFLDEIGELPSELQPKLLRVLEQREIRRIGSNAMVPVDVRVIAATNRDLRAEVNATRFRPDLYFRLAVLRISLPTLRSRPEDIPMLTERVLTAVGAQPERIATLLSPDFIAGLQRMAWPGNVRELRNHLERCLVFDDSVSSSDPMPDSAAPFPAVDPALPYAEARRRTIDEFERRYVEALLRSHRGNVSQAARSSGVDRVYLHRLMRRHGIKS